MSYNNGFLSLYTFVRLFENMSENFIFIPFPPPLLTCRLLYWGFNEVIQSAHNVTAK